MKATILVIKLFSWNTWYLLMSVNKQAVHTYYTHQEIAVPAGFGRDEWLALVHTPATIEDAMRIPTAEAAIGK